MNKYKIKDNKTVVIRDDIVPSTTRTYYSVCIRTMDIVTGLLTKHKFTISDNLYHVLHCNDDWRTFMNMLCNDRERVLDSTLMPKDLALPLITLELKYTWID